MPAKDPLKEAFSKVKEDIFNLQSQIEELKRTSKQTHPTDRQTDTPNRQTDRHPLEPPNPQYLGFSTGNQGVQTDRQTDRQTDTSPQRFAQSTEKIDNITKIEKAAEVLNSLDSLKKDLRIQFKRLTEQEMLVFSTIYQLEDQNLIVDYSLLSQRTNLSESSIRDYIQKLIKKGIPIIKTKENNKRITLSINPNLKKMASLNTLKSLREL